MKYHCPLLWGRQIYILKPLANSSQGRPWCRCWWSISAKSCQPAASRSICIDEKEGSRWADLIQYDGQTVLVEGGRWSTEMAGRPLLAPFGVIKSTSSRTCSTAVHWSSGQLEYSIWNGTKWRIKIWMGVVMIRIIRLLSNCAGDAVSQWKTENVRNASGVLMMVRCREMEESKSVAAGWIRS